MKQCYRLVNECLGLLDVCDIPSRQKLRVRTQLLQLKMVLLNPQPPESFDNFTWLCQELLAGIEKTCDRGGEGESERVDEVTTLIEKAIVAMREGETDVKRQA